MNIMRKWQSIAVSMVVASVVALLAFGIQARFLRGGQTPPALPGPVAQWLLNSASITGTTVADASGSGNTATVVAGPLTFGPMGANFNGTSQYVDNATISTAGWTGITACLWMQPANVTNNYPNVFANSNPGSDNDGFDLSYRTDGAQGYFSVGNGTTSGQVTWTGQQLTAGTWYYYCGTYDGASIQAYINGAQVASTTFAGGALAAGAGHVRVNANPTTSNNLFAGATYDARLYNRALSATEITVLYNANATPVAVNFTTNPVSFLTSTPAGTSQTPFTVVQANGQTYGGAPTPGACSQTLCPLTIGGSTGSWFVATSSATPIAATNQTFVVNAP
jgi:hypothetical protein